MKEKLFTVHKKDFIVQTFRSGGHGGQHQNKTDSGVRIIHKASGARGESRNDKSQYRNKRIALKRLTETNKFKLWIHKMAFEITSGKTIEQRVEEAMNIKNLKIEIKSENDKWIKEPSNMSKKIYTPQDWLDKNFKQSIRDRDNNQCQNPDCLGNCNHLPLHIYHIDNVKKNCHPQNLITLCRGCNTRANYNREYWTEFYQNIMTEQYGYKYE